MFFGGSYKEMIIEFEGYLVKKLLRKGNHFLVNIDCTRLLKTRHKVLRTRRFLRCADHEERQISVTQSEDVVKTVVHPPLEIGHCACEGQVTMQEGCLNLFPCCLGKRQKNIKYINTHIVVQCKAILATLEFQYWNKKQNNLIHPFK